MSNGEAPSRVEMPRVRLGLIGDNIRASRSPDLHRFAGRLCGLDVTYDLLIPPELGKDFDDVFEDCRNGLVSGTNVTYPYKERVVAKVEITDPLIRRIGSVNTVLFRDGRAEGFNTDYTGFVAAWHATFGERRPGRVTMIGAGGVGKAVAFGLAVLGAEEIRLVERDLPKAEALARALRDATDGELRAWVTADLPAALAGATGVVNCTPLGMAGYPGSPVPDGALDGQEWAFDAVYTPVETSFKRQAEAAGAAFLSGYELFFHQGIQAFRIFTGTEPADPAALRRMLVAAARD